MFFIFFPYHFHLNIHLQFGSSTLVKNKWVINLLKPHLLLDTYLGCRPGILNIHITGPSQVLTIGKGSQYWVGRMCPPWLR